MEDMRSRLYSLDSAGALVGVLALLMSACQKAEPRSAIVDKVRNAGAGDVAAAPESGVEEWLRAHADLAVEVNRMCAPVRQGANAEWGNTTEGKVCLAARNAAMSTYRSPRDGRGYHPNQ